MASLLDDDEGGAIPVRLRLNIKRKAGDHSLGRPELGSPCDRHQHRGCGDGWMDRWKAVERQREKHARENKELEERRDSSRQQMLLPTTNERNAENEWGRLLENNLLIMNKGKQNSVCAVHHRRRRPQVSPMRANHRFILGNEFTNTL